MPVNSGSDVCGGPSLRPKEKSAFFMYKKYLYLFKFTGSTNPSMPLAAATYIHHARIGHINSSKILIVQSDDQLRRCQSRLEQMIPFENRHIAFQHLTQKI